MSPDSLDTSWRERVPREPNSDGLDPEARSLKNREQDGLIELQPDGIVRHFANAVTHFAEGDPFGGVHANQAIDWHALLKHHPKTSARKLDQVRTERSLRISQDDELNGLIGREARLSPAVHRALIGPERYSVIISR